jgi:hypothetical protein
LKRLVSGTVTTFVTICGFEPRRAQERKRHVRRVRSQIREQEVGLRLRRSADAPFGEACGPQ